MSVSSRCFVGFLFTLAAFASVAHAQTSGTVPPVYCCDTADEPGLPGQQYCAEGHACCASGAWACNDATGVVACNPCEAACCDPLGEPGQFGNPPCVEGATCCGNGQWQCNDATGDPACNVESLPCPSQCCDPLEEPGTPGNPICVEGATCCSAGTWECNDATGGSTCTLDGAACEACCDPLAEPGQGGTLPCIEGAGCCSNGEWECNDAGGNSTCAVDGIVCEPRCCDPADKPNDTGNVYCASGFTCCADGTWKCNDPTGIATCADEGVECPEICGGIAGIECQDPDDFCKLPTGECCCDAFGVCTSVPIACPEFYDPVCGCDGVTYSNECFADAAQVSVDHPGPCGQVCGGIAGIPCDDGEFCLLPPGQCCCDFEGVCVPIPQVCPEVCDPVCGCDGKTYKNTCAAVMAEVSIEHAGPCSEGDGLITGVSFDSGQKMRWDPLPNALFYNVYRNVPDSTPSFGAGICFATELIDPQVAIPGEPHPGGLWMFQVSGQYPGGEGPLGVNWLCEPRTPSVPCQPSEEFLCEVTGGVWDPLSCGHYPCGQFPACDAIIPGCNCGPGANFFPNVGCMPDPACNS